MELRALERGVGEKALYYGDWRTAINAFDCATIGGITENKRAMIWLREKAQQDSHIGVKIARAIQERVDTRKATAVSSESLLPETPPLVAEPSLVVVKKNIS